MKLLLMFSVAMFAAAHFASAANDQSVEFLRDSDRARGGVKNGVTWKSKVTSTDDGETTEREFTIKAKGDNAIADTLSPKRSVGEIYVFNDRNIWFYKPGLRKPVSISPRQKLTGQAANGDIATTQYARDYTPEVEKTETIDGVKTHVLMLKAKSPNLTYDRIRYWVSDDKHLAVKAEFLTIQGKVFKTARIEYTNTLQVGGQSWPFVSRLAIMDAAFPDNKSVIEYTAPKAVDLADAIFNVNNLAR